ncbi:hypothetical protein GCM10010124_07720 [Pilimelia terevasa]|uniref:ABC transporter domain-containing protein n=1 Tax=Pilimelia terevasa TaxID=53372 RepID=A0A8J3FFC9_9ACTN|nr:ATP-binding cassette domain-containing protein [Pilimelia terevasa]GGK17636.1 hypothetical protein GCM10010124_07720 [Pilimelia terevasa]
MSALEVAVTLRRGAFRRRLDLRVDGGEVVALVGPNGAGKTTALRTLAGLHRPAAGTVRLGGRTLDDVPAGAHVPTHRRRVGLVFQEYLLFGHLSVRENVAFGPRCAGLGRAAARRRADEWLDRMRLAGYAGRRPGHLSGGQAQRVALARALAAAPALLLLDEPLAALDAGLRPAIRAELRAYLRDFAGPTVLVTHDPGDAAALADRVVSLDRPDATGPPGD